MSNTKHKKKEKEDNKEDNEEEEEEEDEDKVDNEDNFESQVENLLIKATTYQSMNTTEKIQNIEQYNSIVATTLEYVETLDACKERLNNIESMKKKKVVYNNKTFTSAMDKIVEIKQKASDSTISLEELLILYEELMNIQVKMTPYLETKKMEIVKI